MPGNKLLLCHCFAVRQAARQITRLYEQRLEPLHLTSAQFSILVRLSEDPGTPIASLAETLGMDRTTALRALRPLVRKRLVAAPYPASDGRQLCVALTAKGSQVLQQARPMWQAAQREFEDLAGVSVAQRLRENLLTVASTAQERASRRVRGRNPKRPVRPSDRGDRPRP